VISDIPGCPSNLASSSLSILVSTSDTARHSYSAAGGSPVNHACGATRVASGHFSSSGAISRHCPAFNPASRGTTCHHPASLASIASSSSTAASLLRPRARGKSTRVTEAIELRRPDDWHLHLRDGDALRAVLPHTARQFARAIVMPNLRPPVVRVDQAAEYRERILAALPPGLEFTPLMTLYLTDVTSPDEIARARASGFVHGVKLYPAGATTNSDAGVTDLARVLPVLEAMQQLGLPLLVHGEVTDPDVDVFDREAEFLRRRLAPLLDRLPDLRVVVEHITTRDAAAFVRAAGPNVAATITAHHLLYSRNAMFAGGIRPHMYCLPVLKREVHREALVEAATGGDPKFFLGTDSAPHARRAKEHACGCAGVYTAHAAIELYAEAFAAAGALDRLEGFASLHGPRFYGLPVNDARIRLHLAPWDVPATYPFGQDELVPLRGGERLAWRLT
jgi:dihydroorotase